MAPRTACGAWSGGREGRDWGNDTKPSIQGFGSSFWGSVLPTVTGPHSHLLTKAPWSLGLPLATSVLVPSMFLALTRLLNCFWLLESPGLNTVESLWHGPRLLQLYLGQPCPTLSCSPAARKLSARSYRGNVSVRPVASGTKHTPDHFIL